jgi:hypothetical protein
MRKRIGANQKWFWCLHCERVFISTNDKKCKYKDCDGHFGDIWSWEAVRSLNHKFPIVPEKDVVYPLYGKN